MGSKHNETGPAIKIYAGWLKGLVTYISAATTTAFIT